MNTVFLEKICRCCLSESEDMIGLFDRVTGIEQFIFEQNFTYSDLIYLCTNVRYDLDVIDGSEHVVELPQNVCETCFQELRLTFLFRQKCESSENVLREQTIGIGNHLKEEVVGFNQTADARDCERLFQINTFAENIKEKLPNEECIIVNTKEPILIAKYEHLESQLNDVEVEVVSIASNNVEHTTDSTKQQITSATYLCKICEKHFLHELQFQTHIQEQHHDTKYNCNECTKKFQTEKNFLVHQSVHQPNQTTKKEFLCSICGKIFATKQRLKVHAATHTREKRHKCGECEKQFSSESRLRCHRRTHTGEKPYRCDECDLTFAQGNALRCHKRIHSGERPYECPFCPKKFIQNTILKTHMTLHTGKTVKCPDCDKLFSRASNLILHRREHTGDRPYACDRCPNRYKQKSHLDRHKDTHLGIKHTCEVCQKVYSKRWSLKIHMFTHSDEKPHRCSYCNSCFARRDKFKNHMKSNHGITSFDK